MALVWVTNTMKDGPEFGTQQEKQEYWRWRRTLVEGEPKAGHYTVQELKEKKMVGLYKQEEEKKDNDILDILPCTMGYL